uniref:Ras-associating domain-containing protein n=1 Tax=Mesocestoides corti TaxID=53468 RepID=A0A5K3FDN9_MESCO
MALVEKVPSMKLERCFEDDECVRDCILSWPIHCTNLIFFEERQDVFGLFEDPQTWLGNTLEGKSAQMKNSLLKDMLEKDGSNRLPPFKDYLYILHPGNKWKRRYCVLRSSGLYASKKRGSGISDLARVTAFGDHLYLYTTIGGWLKDNAPTPYGFVLKILVYK